MAPTKKRRQEVTDEKNVEATNVTTTKQKPKEKRKKEEMAKTDHDAMAITIMRCTTVWQGKHTKDVLVPQLRNPKIHVSIDNEEVMVYAYDSKMRNVSCGRNLKQMLPSDVYDFLIPELSKNHGVMFDGTRYFIRTTGSHTMFQLAIEKVIDHQRYVLKKKNFKLAFLSSGQAKYLSSFWEDMLKNREYLTAYIVTGSQTNTFVEPGGLETVNRLGIKKRYKKSIKGERGTIDHYETITELERVSEKRIRKLKTIR
ncbi:unnamed protein product [Bemisia tabaci]|uniref:Uncharacterized protein n=1 Tax=Bemisia tabaci TaxID=7038 RepID=A0A9P0F186_BEMTA|nr:unnamed protein product [Bemisia tabaci]